MIELKDNQLIFHFPEVHPDAHCTIEFQRTLRLPDDNREYALPPGLGRFPLMHVDDLGERPPAAWARRGGVCLPMYQAEAMWINFESDYPFAIKVAAGKINAVTGDTWSDALHSDPQDYLVLPEQPWLDGFCVAKGLIRQFVAMPLGDGYTAEEQLTGKAEYGGLQIVAYPMKGEIYERRFAEQALLDAQLYSAALFEPEAEFDMGLAPGGLMRQRIRADDYGLETWDTESFSRCYVHIANSQAYEALTGHAPPSSPPTAKAYTDAGLPWFEYYDENSPALSGSQTLAGLDSIAAKGIKLGEKPLPENEAVEPAHIKKLGTKTVREEEF
ncbi:MAG: hypothetical protein ACE5ET_04225 [Gammaproteobacteria bacterium]